MRLVVGSQQIVYYDSTGRPVRILEVNADLTERKAAEARLRETDQKLRQLAENISEVFWMSDPSPKPTAFRRAQLTKPFGVIPAKAFMSPLPLGLRPFTPRIATGFCNPR